jgi:hypothetical protein
MKRALEGYHAREARIIPIIVRQSNWQSTPFGMFQAILVNGKPIKLCADRDEAFVKVAKDIRRVVGSLSQKY